MMTRQQLINARRRLEANGWTHSMSVMADDANAPGVTNFGLAFTKDGTTFWLNYKTIHLVTLPAPKKN